MAVGGRRGRGREVEGVRSKIARTKAAQGNFSPIPFSPQREGVPAEEALISEPLLNRIHSGPVRVVGELVRFLRSAEAAAVDAVVDLGVDNARRREAERVA